MSWLDSTRTRIGLLFSRRSFESRINSEIQFHIDMEAERLRRESGLDADEARRRALISFGGVTSHTEALRDGRGIPFVRFVNADRLRQSFRTLMRDKRFSVVAILSLAVAIALNTTMYSVIDALFLPKLAMDHPERLVYVNYFGRAKSRFPSSVMRSALDSMQFHTGITGALGWRNAVASDDNAALAIPGVWVAPNYFEVTGLKAMAGRVLTEADLFDPERPVVISERLWQQLFPTAKAFERRTIWVGSVTRTVVGILPRAAALPMVPAEVWGLPGPAPEELGAIPHNLLRLRDDDAWNDMTVQLNAFGKRIIAETGDSKVRGAAGFLVKPADTRGSFTMDLRLGSVLAVLLIACANLANLQLARGVSRARELATRAALGASRKDLISQLVLESSWLALGGLLLGSLLTAWGMHIVDATVPPVIGDYVTQPQLSWRVFVFAIAATVFALMLVGLAPALLLSRVDISHVMKTGAGTGRSRNTRRQYGVLVVAEIALALALLASTGLIVRAALYVRSYAAAREQQINLATTTIGVRRPSMGDRRSVRDWSAIIRQQALSVDSTLNAATSRTVGGHRVAVYGDDGHPIDKQKFPLSYYVVSPEYFRTLGTSVLAGRDFAPGEFAGSLVIVDRDAARTLWPGRSAVSQQMKVGGINANAPWSTVIGVVEREERLVRNQDDAVAPADAVKGEFFTGNIYLLNSGDTLPLRPDTGLFAQRCRVIQFFCGAYMTLNVRTHISAETAPRKLHAALSALGTNVTANVPTTMAAELALTRAPYDFIASMFAVFAALAMGLAGLGVYSIISHTVAQRTREFGVRIAIGAEDRDIREAVSRDGRTLVLIGIAVGLVLTYFAAGFVRGFVFSDYDRYDSRVFAVISLFLFAVTWLASYIPARRAMRINPVEALRND